jgi:hypothetical protein
VAFAREADFYMGSIYVNYGLTALIVSSGYPLLLFNKVVDEQPLLAMATAFFSPLPDLVLSVCTRALDGARRALRSTRNNGLAAILIQRGSLVFVNVTQRLKAVIRPQPNPSVFQVDETANGR